MIKYYLFLAIALCWFGVKAQNIAINETGAAPDPSAMLDITSPDKGILIPRLPDHTAIAAPVQGLLVYNTTDNGFWYFDGTVWIPLLGGNLGWRIDGNEFTDATINFLGTLDEQPLMVRVNDIPAGRIDWTTEFPFNALGRQGVTSIGKNSLSALTSGEFNSAFGYESGSTLSTGDNNVLVGYQSGLNMTSGFMNTFVGSESGRQITTGNRNTYIGHFAGRSTATGRENVAIGWEANSEGGALLGNENVFIGSRAGKRTNAVNANVMVGSGAGEFNVDGRNNTFIGYNSGRGDNTFSPGRENAFVGSQTGSSCNTCQWNVLMGNSAGQNISTGNSNVFIGHRAGINLTTGANNLFLGFRAGEYLPATTSNRLIIANNLNQADVLISGNFATNQVGINTAVPAQTLSVNGSAGKTDGPDWSVFSDERVKKNVKAFNDGLNVVMQLRPVRFQYKENSGVTDTDNEFIGFVAQDVEKVAPYMVNLYDDSNGPSGYSDKRVLNTSALNQILVNALQEQQQKIEDLESRLQRIENLLLEKNENATAEKH